MGLSAKNSLALNIWKHCAEFTRSFSSQASQASQRQASASAALDALAKAEAKTGGSLHTATLAENLATTVRDLIAGEPEMRSGPLTVEALAGARDLAARIGDESNLALDPDLDSYYIQNIVVKRVPALLSQMGELQSLLTAFAIWRRSSGASLAPRRNDPIKHRGHRPGRRGSLPQRCRWSTEAAIAAPISSMVSAVNSYLGTANTVLRGQGNPTSLTPAIEAAFQSVDNAWAVSKAELYGLLNNRLANLLGKLRGSLLSTAWSRVSACCSPP